VAGCGIFVEVFQTAFINEQIGQSFTGDANNIFVVILDPAADFLAIDQFHHHRSAVFGKSVDVLGFTESRFRRGKAAIASAGVLIGITYCHVGKYATGYTEFMAVEAILFDLGKVLIDFSMDPVLQKFGETSSRSPEELEQVFRDSKLAYEYESGAISTDEFYQRLCELGGVQMEKSEFCSIWSDVFAPEPLVSEDLVKTLADRYPLILVSNTNELHADYLLERYPVLDYFGHKVFSFEVGAMKPERRIYERAIALSGKPAERLFFTDDREENVFGAREMGIQAHQFRSEDELIQALASAGVEVE
jgi:FMN phosphatase YigB (HAD superfamily)